MPGFAQTVTGLVPSSDLGPTLMHEHILCDLRSPVTRGETDDAQPITMQNRFEVDYFQNRNPANMYLNDGPTALRELARFKAAGGGTIVDVTCGGLSPQPRHLAELASAAQLNIVMGAGFYVDAYLSDTIRAAEIDELADMMTRQLTEGAWGTDVRAGLIGEIGCSWPLADSERRTLQAAAMVQSKTGVAITIHPGRHEDAPAEIAELLSDCGVEPTATVIGHMDRTIFGRDRLIDLLRLGFVLEWDFFGIETSQYWMGGVDLDLPTDYMRIDLIGDLMEAGYRDQIAVSQDICTRTRLASYGGHGYGHLFQHVVPLMRRRGWRDSDIDQLVVQTPARLLGYRSDAGSGRKVA